MVLFFMVALVVCFVASFSVVAVNYVGRSGIPTFVEPTVEEAEGVPNAGILGKMIDRIDENGMIKTIFLSLTLVQHAAFIIWRLHDPVLAHSFPGGLVACGFFLPSLAAAAMLLFYTTPTVEEYYKGMIKNTPMSEEEEGRIKLKLFRQLGWLENMAFVVVLVNTGIPIMISQMNLF